MDETITRPLNALIPQDRLQAYLGAGWTCVNPQAPWCYEDEARALLRWERGGEPVIPPVDDARP